MSEAQPLYRVEWDRIFLQGLKIKAVDATANVSLDLDDENVAAVLRARAGRCWRDLQGTGIWVFMMLSQLGRVCLACGLAGLAWQSVG
jgi:hypothetical protein